MPTDSRKEIRVGIRKLRGNLKHYVKRVSVAKVTVLITSRGAVVGELRAPPQSVLPPRRPGALKGRIKIAEDFDALPGDVEERANDGSSSP